MEAEQRRQGIRKKGLGQSFLEYEYSLFVQLSEIKGYVSIPGSAESRSGIFDMNRRMKHSARRSWEALKTTYIAKNAPWKQSIVLARLEIGLGLLPYSNRFKF